MKEIERQTPKEQFLAQFQQLHESEFLPPEWDNDKKARVAFLTSPGRTKTSIYTSIPMECRGKACPFASTCGLLKEGLAPVEYPCPYEMGMVKTFMSDYIEDLNIDIENSIELCQVRDIVDIEVQYLRKTKILAKEDFIQEYVVGVDKSGELVMSTRLHLAVDLDEKLSKKKAMILKQLLATRESKAKAGLASFEQAASMASLIGNYMNVALEKEKRTKELAGIVDHDDYIDADINEEKNGDENEDS